MRISAVYFLLKIGHLCQIVNSMASIYEKFGEEVKKVRKKRTLTQEDLAELIKRDPRTIVAIESGKRNPTLQTIHKIAQALKVKSSQLLPF